MRPPDATTCKKCANAGVECIVPKYHVGRYKGVKNKRSGLDKAIHQVEEAVKKARTKGTTFHDEHARALRKLLDDSEDVSQRDTIENDMGDAREKMIPHEVPALTADHVPIPLQEVPGVRPMSSESLTRNIEEDGDVTVSNANNPLQLLAIASAIPESTVGDLSPELSHGISPSTTAAATGDDDETRDFFSPMTSKLDVGKDLDPQDLGLVSDQEVESLFN